MTISAGSHQIGDVGVVDDMVHIGDEAMFEAAHGELTARGAAITAISSAPDETSERYGVDAVPRIRFDGLDRDAAEARLRAVREAAAGAATLSADDPALEVIAAIAEGEATLNGRGRLVIRPSGTEPLIRVMAEGDDAGQVEQVVDMICDAVRAAAA